MRDAWMAERRFEGAILAAAELAGKRNHSGKWRRVVASSCGASRGEVCAQEVLERLGGTPNGGAAGRRAGDPAAAAEQSSEESGG